MRARWFTPAPVALTVALVAVACRLPHVFGDALWQDEVASARILREPSFGRMLGRVVQTESTPPLWYALGWALHRLGMTIISVRLLSVLFGAGLAAAVVSACRRVLPLRFASVAGLLVAIGAQFVWHGHELRAYELLALVAVLFALTLRRTLQAPAIRDDVALGALAAAGLLTHYFFTFTVASGLGWLWLEPQARPIRKRATLAIAAGTAACLPWLPYFLRQRSHNRYWWITPFRLRDAVSAPLHLFSSFTSHWLDGWVAPLLFLTLVGVGVAILARRSPTGRLYAALALGPWLGAAAAWSLGARVFDVRNLIETGPFFAIALVAAARAAPRRIGPAALAAICCAALLSFALTPQTQFPRYDLVARALVREGWRAGNPLAVFGNFFNLRSPLEWYLPDQPVLDVSRSTPHACETVFVIGAAQQTEGLHGLRADAAVGGYLVGRVDLDRPIARSSLASATILASPRSAPPCVRIADVRRVPA